MQINSSEIINNINKIYTTYGSKIKSDFHLIVAYWRLYDGIEMDGGRIEISSLLDKATNPDFIIKGKLMYDVLKESGEIENT